MTNRRIFIVTNLIFLLFVWSGTTCIAAEVVGQVINLNGPLFAHGSTGVVRVLAKDSAVEVGDLLVTEKRTYARIRFVDQSTVTLRPETQFRVESFSYAQDKPETDNAVLNLVKGGMRALTGEIGKRHRPDDYQVKTPAATIGIRGTVYEVRVCAGNCAGQADGIYFYVLQGEIEVGNASGTVLIGTGQYAFVSDSATVPEILQTQPNIDFSVPVLPGEDASGAEASGVLSGSCEVR